MANGVGQALLRSDNGVYSAGRRSILEILPHKYPSDPTSGRSPVNVVDRDQALAKRNCFERVDEKRISCVSTERDRKGAL